MFFLLAIVVVDLTINDKHTRLVKYANSVYNKRSSSKSMGTSDQKTSPKKMKITQPPQIVDLEEEDPKEQVNLDMVESGTSTVDVENGSKLQSEAISRTFNSKKHIFDKKKLGKLINPKKTWQNSMLRKEIWPWVR
jgi:hypothetical protein